MSSRVRPIFCGNLDYVARHSDIERLFGKYGNVERVDLKSGFAFIYMKDERDADDAVRRLDNREFGPKGRRLRVEWTKQDRAGKKSDDSRKSNSRPSKTLFVINFDPINTRPRQQDRAGKKSDDSRKSNSRPSKTLFVINFDPINTRPRDLERHFDSNEKINNVRIRRNFAFVQFETQEDATKALEATNSSKFMDRVISVEYASRDNDDNQRNDSRRNGRSPDRRVRERSIERGYNGKRSPSPYRRERDSPDYGHGSKPVSHYEPRRRPSYERTDFSPVNNAEIRRSSRHERRRSPSYEPKQSLCYDRKRSPSYDRKRSPSYDGPDKSPANDHDAKL